MTAIAGFWGFGASGVAERSCRVMLDAQQVYGPDHRHLTRLGQFTAGRNLFRLLPEDDLDCGVLSGGQSFLLAADLRLDNRADLAAALAMSPGEAATRSDAALLFAGLERWGEAVVDRLVGDFAFAFYNHRSRRLVLARDPLGQRPLFWHRGRDFFAFSSMPAGLLALPQIAGGANLDMAARFAALLPQLGQDSFHEQIRRVQPGHLLVVTAAGEDSRRCWRPKRHEVQRRSFDDYVEEYRSTLDQAVASRLRGAGGLVASHLSGGWDSSAVTATAARLLSGGIGEVVAYTSIPGKSVPAPGDRFADEAPLASATAVLYPNIQHHLMRSPAGSLIAYLDQAERLFARPPFNLCNHDWLANIRSAAREAGARVLLTGEIGNWTISSAPTTLLADFVRTGQVSAWAREARGVLKGRRARVRGVLAASFGPWMPTSLWRLTAGLSSDVGVETPLRPAYLTRLRDEIDDRRFGPASRPKNYREQTTAGLSQLDFGQYRKGILGGWGIDKRDATADMRLVEFMLSLPLEMFHHNGERRPLARAALADRLPAAVLDERRKGYQAADWHFGLRRHLPEVERLLDRMDADPRASDLIDVGRLRQWVSDIPSTGWERPEIISRYRTSLLFALSAGHFIVSNPA